MCVLISTCDTNDAVTDLGEVNIETKHKQKHPWESDNPTTPPVLDGDTLTVLGQKLKNP